MTLGGESPPRLEARLKVTGAARYTADIPVDGMLHAALVVAPIPSGRVLRIDDSRARALPGFVEMLTHENAPRLAPAAFLTLLQGPTVHFAGQPVAAVVAESSSLARQCAAVVDVTYDALPAVTAVHQRLGHVFAPKEAAGGVATDSCRGDLAQGFAQADVVIDQRYATAANNHHPMEPHAVIAFQDGDTLTVLTTTQAVFAARQAIARCLGIPTERVRVISKYLGGGFGAKGRAWLPGLLLGVTLARAIARPVKLELTRAQMFSLVGRRQETIQHVRLGAMREGRLTAIAHDTVAQTSTYGEHVDPTGTPARMLYACDNVATTHRLVRINAPQPNPMRAPGEGPGSFALETALDEMAHELGIDPLALRLRNYADRDQHADLPWSSNSLRACYRIAAQAFGWEKRPREVGSLRDGHHLVGWGMATACYPVYRMASEAMVRIEKDGAVLVRCGTQDMGTGTITVLAQLAAATLGVPLERVAVEIGDTHLPEGPYSGGSMATASFTPAVEEAARALRRRLIDLAVSDPASPMHGHSVDSVVLDLGYLRSQIGNQSEPVAGLLSRAAADGLEELACVVPNEKLVYSSYAYGAVFAEVRLDPELGEVRVTRLTAAYAAGRILNPLLARSQFVGGLVGGIGMALHEAAITDERLGRIVNDNLLDYLIPVHADMPRFDIHLVEEDDEHIAGGVKGIGMLGTVGTAGAIANAVFHASGRRIRTLPIRPEHAFGPTDGLPRCP